MLRRAALGLAALVLAACAQRPDPGRGLPADRTTPLLYVALGDSTVEGVGASRPDLNYVSRLAARLRERYPAARAVNLGVGGATSADVVTAQLDRAITLSPQLVTLSVGPNDITTGVPVRRYERNVTTILASLTGQTRAVVVVNLLPDLGTTRRFRGGPHEDKVRGLTIQFNEILAAVARAHGVDVVDLYTPSRQEVPRHPELLAADGYHPSDAGYARWAELMWRGIQRRMIRGG
jgi:lysophospholipase L1-like esterase